MSRTRTKRAAARLLAMLLAVLLGAALSGCLEHPFHHSRREVLAYIEELFPGEDITVSRRYTEKPDRYHDRTIRTWDCWFTDLPDAVFQVSNAWWSSSLIPMAGYGLGCNARDAFWDYYLEQYLQEVGSLDAWEIERNRLSLSYSAMDPVYSAQEQLQAFYDWLMDQPHVQEPYPAACRLVDLPLPALDLNVSASILPEATNWASACGDMAKVCANMMRAYYTFYSLPCPEFSAEELEDFALARWTWTPNKYPYPSSCSRDGEPVPLSTFTGIGLDHSHHISYAGAYEMLSRLGFELEGTADAFSFTGADGALYEFSYESVLHRQGESDWWYFLRDGKPVVSDRSIAPVLSLSGEALKAMTGLEFSLYP